MRTRIKKITRINDSNQWTVYVPQVTKYNVFQIFLLRIYNILAFVLIEGWFILWEELYLCEDEDWIKNITKNKISSRAVPLNCEGKFGFETLEEAKNLIDRYRNQENKRKSEEKERQRLRESQPTTRTIDVSYIKY